VAKVLLTTREPGRRDRAAIAVAAVLLVAATAYLV
jgi:hypothetical protein